MRNTFTFVKNDNGSKFGIVTNIKSARTRCEMC